MSRRLKGASALAGVVSVGLTAAVLVAQLSAGERDTASAAEYATKPPGLAADRLQTIPAEPPEFVMRPRLPLCGAEPPKGLSVRRSRVARRCLLSAWRQALPAELISVSPSVEGPFLVIYRVIGDGKVEALSDDPFGQGPIRKICRRLRVSLKRASGPANEFQPTGIRASRCRRAETWG